MHVVKNFVHVESNGSSRKVILPYYVLLVPSYDQIYLRQAQLRYQTNSSTSLKFEMQKFSGLLAA